MEKNLNHEGIITEADTCREFVTPRLVQVGWSISPHSIGEQRSFTNGRIFVTGGKVRRGQQKRADYLLYYRRDFPLAVVEVKSIAFPAETGVQQAREYAEILGLKFAYATNGRRWAVLANLQSRPKKSTCQRGTGACRPQRTDSQHA
jgi:type I restriction enzyme R subunit